MFLKKILKIHILCRKYVRKKYELSLSTIFSGNLVDKYFLTPKQLLYIILLLATLREKYALDSNRIRIAGSVGAAGAVISGCSKGYVTPRMPQPHAAG